jgi:hypothetical protein
LESKFKPAPEVKRIADVLIAKYHPHLLDPSVRMYYRWVEKAPKKNGKTVYGRASKVDGLALSLVDHDGPCFCIVISKDRWFMLSPAQRDALVDHQLCHCGLSEDNEPRAEMWPHDLEEFRQIVQRHGLWLEDVEAMAKTMSLFNDYDLGELNAGRGNK